MKSSVSMLKEQFKTHEDTVIKEMKTLNTEISKLYVKGNENFEKVMCSF